ncbi:MAG TPA: GDYXXLXY domain-containing protein [Chthoniobacterales bacterium]|nr:GDYXXLXY domain-containing protein [Chthoniobacterales bacterium]
MNKLRLMIFIVVALAQISVPASMIWKRQRTLREGRLWKFRTVPVDPVDAMRGRYLVLRFEAEEFPRPERWPSAFEETVYVRLKEDANGFAAVDQMNDALGEGTDTVPARNLGYYEGKQRLRFPFDRFWVTEARARAAEKAYAEHSRREKIDAYATVRVFNDDAAIEELYIAGQPLRDYLRAHPP